MNRKTTKTKQNKTKQNKHGQRQNKTKQFAVRELSILAVSPAKFKPLREPIRILLFIADQVSHVICAIILNKIAG